MNLTFTHSPILLTLCLVLAGAGAWWAYRRTIPDVSPARKIFLGTVRFLVLAIILFLLFEPLFERIRTESNPPVLAVLVDGSQSMLLADSLATEGALSAREVVDELQRTASGYETRTFSFGTTTSPLDTLAAVRFEQSRTDMSAALEAVRASLSEQPLGAVILFSDGLHNSGTNPVYVAERYPVPIISIAHGDTTAQRDLRIVQIVTNELAYSGTTVPVQVRVRNDGFTGGRISVTLQEDTGVLSQQTLALPPSGAEATVELEFEAEEPGLRTMEVIIYRLDGEATYRNNRESISVQVLDQKKSILLVAGAPSPDVSAMTRAFETDENIDLTSIVQKGPGTWFGDGLPVDLSEFDLVVAVGFPGGSTSPTDSRRVATAVSEGIPLLLVMDRAIDLRAVQRDYSAVLPVAPTTIRSGYVTGSFVQTSSASTHAIFDIDNRRDASLWRRLPPLIMSDSRWTLAPGATVLAQPEIRGVTLDAPLFVVGRHGRVRSAAILGSGLWRWANVPTDLEDESTHWQAVQENLIQWLYTTDDDRLVRVRPAEASVSEGDPVIMRGEVYDESLNPVSDASLTLNLQSPTGENFPYEMQSVGNGRYSLDLGSLPSGTYTYNASATREDAEIGSDDGTFRIGERTLEFRSTHSDYALLDQISARSGGMRIGSGELNRIPGILDTLPTFVPHSEVVSTQTRLWQRVPFLIVLLILVTTEWFFRKRFGMV